MKFADVFAAFELKYHGRASPKPVIPPFRKRLYLKVHGQIQMETYEEVDPADPQGPKYVVHVVNGQPNPVDFFATWSVVYAANPNFLVPSAKLHVEIPAKE